MNIKQSVSILVQKKTTVALLLVLSIVIFSPAIIKLNLFNISLQIKKIFSVEVNNTIRDGYLDEVWDFEKVPREDKSGYDMWILGRNGVDISAARVASGVTVGTTTFSNINLNMNYVSMNEYYNNGGPENFRNFINNSK